MNYLTKNDYGYAISAGCISGIATGVFVFVINSLIGINKWLAPSVAIITFTLETTLFLIRKHRYRVALTVLHEVALIENEEMERKNKDGTGS
jgi:hypothetical protein